MYTLTLPEAEGPYCPLWQPQWRLGLSAKVMVVHPERGWAAEFEDPCR